MKSLPLLLILVLGPYAGQATPKPVEVLRFAWPENLTATVDDERRKELRQGTQEPKISITKVRFRMRSDQHPKGRVIRHTDHALIGENLDAQTAEAVSQIAASLVPSVVVTNSGEYVGIEDVESLRRAMIGMIAPENKDPQKVPPGVRELIAAITSAEFLDSMASQEWQSLVGFWIGLPLGPAPTAFEREQPFPGMPGVVLTLKGQSRMVSKGDCQRGGVTLACATFEMTSSTDPKGIEALMKRALSGAGGMEGVTVDRIEVSHVVRVTLETATMVPHGWSLQKDFGFAMTHPKEGRFEATQKETRATKYSYPPK